MNVPLLDLKGQLAEFREEIIAAVTEVIDSTCYILGPKVEALEKEIARYCGSNQAIGVASGTDALLASLMAMGVGPGDLVLTTPYTFFATLGSILRLGARPLFVDIDPVTYNISPEAMATVLAADPDLTARIKVMLPVHLYGQCADMARIMALAEQYNIPVLEDAAQAIGAACPMPENGTVTWRRAGSIGLAGCFSFFPSKNLGCAGDGGMITCNDEKLAELIRVIRVHGGAPKYHHHIIGGNFRLDAIQAAVLLVKLQRLPAWHQKRRCNAGRYDALFPQTGLLEAGHIRTPQAVYRHLDTGGNGPGADFHIYNQYVVRARQRDGLRDFLAAEGIGAEVYYPIPLHKQKCVTNLGLNDLTFPESEKAALETLALPIYPELSEEMQEHVVQRIAAFYKK